MSKNEEILIVRTRVSENFTVLRNAIFEDNRLTWAALGLLVYILHLPPNFKLKLYNLANARKGTTGRHATRSAIKVLEGTGYVKIVRSRNQRGQYEQTTWYVTDSPDFR